MASSLRNPRRPGGFRSRALLRIDNGAGKRPGMGLKIVQMIYGGDLYWEKPAFCHL